MGTDCDGSNEFDQSSFTLITDLDGTVLPRPYGSPAVHPPVQDGPAFAQLVRLLKAGASIIGITGSEIVTHDARFFSPLPIEARKGGQVLIAVNTGRQLFRANAESGQLLEDHEYGTHINSRVPHFPKETINALVALGRAGLRRFLLDLHNDPTLVADDSPLVFMRGKTSLANADKAAIPVNPPDGSCPRIEIRNDGAGVVFVGVPSNLGAAYFQLPPELLQTVDGKACGRMCFDCLPRGLSKRLVVEYLLEHNMVQAGRAVAVGDRPAGNDEGLTLWHENGIPFVSVAEHPSLVPPHLLSTHVSALHNEHAAAAFLDKIASWLEEGKAVPPLGVSDVEEMVSQVNQAAAADQCSSCFPGFCQ